MGDGDVQPLDPLQEDAFTSFHRQVDPAAFEFAAVVVGERGDGLIGLVRKEDAALDEDLKAVADAEDELAGGFEVLQSLGQMVANLVAENPSGGHIISVTEAAGDAEDLGGGEGFWIF